MTAHIHIPTDDEIAALTDHELADMFARAKWAATRRPNQVPPPGDWDVWLLLAGRGFGKTRTAAETLREWMLDDPGTRWLVSGRTTSEMRALCFEGESGLLSVIPHELIAKYNATLFELTLTNGSFAKGIGAEKPDAFRGGSYHGGWLDELASWLRLQQAWDMIMFSMRLGTNPRMIVSTTPKPRDLIRKLSKNQLTARVVISKGSTRENFANLAPTFQRQIMQYEGTALGRQEIDAEVLDNSESGVIKRGWIVPWYQKFPGGKRRPLPAFDRIIISLDTAFTEKARNDDKKSEDFGKPDPTSCGVWGVWYDRRSRLPKVLLLYAWSDFLGLPGLVEAVKRELAIRYGGEEQKPVIKPQIGPAKPFEAGRPPDDVLIEDKGSGISLRQVLRDEGIVTIAYNPGKADKLARLHAVSHLFHAGMVHMPVDSEPPIDRDAQPTFMSWAEAVIEQLTNFMGEGTIEHDDHVDQTSQAIRWIYDTFGISVNVEPEPEETIPGKGQLVNPYG